MLDEAALRRSRDWRTRHKQPCPNAGCGNLKDPRSRECYRCGRKRFAERQRGSNNPSWNGGRTIGGHGYVWVRNPEHPKAQANGYVLEHRLVMEAQLGRHLLPGENVHHRNGVRADNRIENLELWITGQPKGQRVEDQVAWAKEILERYPDA